MYFLHQKDGLSVLRCKFSRNLRKLFLIADIFNKNRCQVKKNNYRLKKTAEPFILVVNRSSPQDINYIFSVFKASLKFLMNQQELGIGIKSKILFRKYSPIIKSGSSTDSFSAEQIQKALHNRENVCIFQGEEPSFCGVTSEINPDIGRLVKDSGAKLITFKLTGSYFSNPIWATTKRRGIVSGSIVSVYEKEQLEKLKPEQITAKIKNDIQENAYARQKLEHKCFKGKKIAEGLETCVCVCPKCHRIETIKTDDNTVFCENCGEYTEMDTFGYFSEGFMFHTLEQWDDWQKKYLNTYTENLLAKAGSQKIFSEEQAQLKIIKNNFPKSKTEQGSFVLYTDKMVFRSASEELSVYITEVNSITFYTKNVLNISIEKDLNYQLSFKSNKNLRKYQIVMDSLKNHI